MVGQVHNLLRKGFCLITLLLCLLGLLSGGAGVAAAQGWRSPWRTFTTADGLASDTVTAIYQTQDGTLWFGTMQGVSRYNGEWETYTTADGLAHNEATAIFQDQGGIVWVGTRGGLSLYDGQWLILTPSDGLAGRDVSTISQLEDGALWFGTLDGGISRLQAGEWHTFTMADDLPSDRITAVAQGRRGDIWVGTPLGLAHYDRHEWRTYSTAEGLPDNMVTAILAAEDGTIWVGTLRGLSRFRPDAGGTSWQTFFPEDGLAGEHVTALLQDSEGTLWVGTTEGVSLYDGQQWRTWTQKDGLASSDVRAIYEDSDGGLWFGTSAGVSYCDLTWRLYFLPPEGEGESTALHDVSALAQSRDGALWIATLGGGVVRYQGGHWHIYTSAQGLADDNVFALAEDPHGALWFGTAGGVSRYLAGTWETYTTAAGLPTNVVLSVEAAGDGTLWFGTAGGGVVRYRPEEGEGWRTFTQRDGLADNYVRAICEAQDGALWLGTSKGVNRFDGHSWQLFTSQSTDGGLPGDEVRDIWCASDGSLWFATNQGAACYDGSSWRSYEREDGLPSSSVNTIWKEKEDIWFGTSGGLCRYDGHTWQVYTPHHGLPSSHILSVLYSAPDTWWIGTTGGGLVRYRPERTPPWARVVSINDHPVLTHTLILPAEERNVVISFVGGDIHTGSEQLLYMHKLEDVGEDWAHGRDRFALYHDLAPGTYTLWLMARDEDFNYSKPYSVAITIPPRPIAPAPAPVPSPYRSGLPWRYTWLGLPLLAVLGISYWGYGQWRARQAVRRGFNPYICGPPIHDEGMFFGREDILREILQIIHNNNIIIYGERRIGKTTLLYQLARRLKKLEDPDYAFFPAFINLQGIPQDRLFLLLAQSVAQEVEDEVGSLGLVCRSRGREGASPSPPGLDWRPPRTGYNNFDFQEDLAVIMQALQATTSKDARLILLVDEADVISTYDHTVQEQLRGALMSSVARQVKVVLAGTYISKEWHLQSSPWYNLFSREIMLLPFDVEEVKRLIQQPVQGIYRYDQEAIRRIIAYSDRKPFEAQKLCLHAVRETLGRKRRHITTSEVEGALKSALEERASEFQQLWEAMSPDGQRALQVLVKSLPGAAPGQAQGGRREQTLPRLPLSDEDRELLMEGGVLYRYQKREHLLTSFQEWIRRESP